MELNQQTEKAFEVDSDEDAKIKFGNISINYQPLLDIFDPHDNPLAADERARELFLNPNVDTQSLIEKKRPEGASLFSREGFFGVSGSGYSRKDLFNLIKNDKQFAEDFEYAENQRAIQKRESDENSLRNKSYDLFTKNLGLDPKTAGSLTTVMDWTPFLGAATGLEDAVDAYRRGDITEAAFLGALSAIDVVPYAGKLISNSIKGVVDPTVVKQIFAGERAAENVPIPVVKEDLSSYSVSGKGTDNIKRFKKEFDDFLKTNNISKDPSTSFSDMLANLDNETREKVLNKLDSLWTKEGVTYNAIGSPVFEIDDSVTSFDEDRFINLIQLDKNRRLEGDSHPFRLSQVYDNKELFKAYPSLKDLPIRQMTDAERLELGDGTRATFSASSPLGDNSGRTGPVILFRDMATIKDLQSGIQGRKESAVLEILNHELQHVVQRLENYPSVHQDIVKEALEDSVYRINKDIVKFSDPSLMAAIPNSDSYLASLKFRLNDLRSKLSPVSRDFDIYEHLYTEIDARNVQDRMWLKFLERREKNPWRTMSVRTPTISGHDILALRYDLYNFNNPNRDVNLKAYADTMSEITEGLTEEFALKEGLDILPNGELNFKNLEQEEKYKDLIENVLFRKKAPINYKREVASQEITDDKMRLLMRGLGMDNVPSIYGKSKIMTEKGEVPNSRLLLTKALQETFPDVEFYDDFLEAWTTISEDTLRTGLDPEMGIKSLGGTPPPSLEPKDITTLDTSVYKGVKTVYDEKGKLKDARYPLGKNTRMEAFNINKVLPKNAGFDMDIIPPNRPTSRINRTQQKKYLKSRNT